MKAYKGFNKDMTCRGFQYKEGETYKHDGYVKCCNSGLHSCEYPLDVFHYYDPSESVYHEVDAGGNIDWSNDGDTKISSSEIKIGASVSLQTMIEASVNFVFSRCKKSKGNTSSGYRGAASNSGYIGAASNSGDSGAASNSGYRGAAYSNGVYSEAKTIHEKSFAVATGPESAVAGVVGAWLVCAEWDEEFENIKSVKTIRVDGKKIKENTMYTIKRGKWVQKKCQ